MLVHQLSWTFGADANTSVTEKTFINLVIFLIGRNTILELFYNRKIWARFVIIQQFFTQAS